MTLAPVEASRPFDVANCVREKRQYHEATFSRKIDLAEVMAPPAFFGSRAEASLLKGQK
jgi:hypothetical protein